MKVNEFSIPQIKPRISEKLLTYECFLKTYAYFCGIIIKRCTLKNIFIIFFFFIIALNGWSQNTNPFQIGTPKTKKYKKRDKTPVFTKKDTISIKSSGNPFEIDGTPKQNIATTKNLPDTNLLDTNSTNSNPFSIGEDPKQVNDTVSNSNPFDITAKPTITPQPTQRKPIAQNKTSIKKSNLLFYLITGSLFLFTLLLTVYRAYFKRVYQTFLSSNLLKTIYQKVNNSNNYSVFLLLYSIFFFNFALFIYLALINLEINISPTGYTFFIILFGLVAFFVLRHIILKILSAVFPVQENIGLYNFLIINFNIGIGVVLLPLNLFIAYVSPEIGRIIIYFTLGILAILIMYKIFRGLDIAKKIIRYHKLHFFLYLCTIEIAPLLILIKYLSKLGY